MANFAGSAACKTLVVDTCSLLDIVRAPIRSSITPSQVQHALQIERALGMAPQSVRVLVCDWVIGEYQRGVEGVMQAARQH